MKKALDIIIRFQAFIMLLLLIGVVGYTMSQVSQVVNVTPNQAYVNSQTQSLDSTAIKFNQTTINAVQQLTPVNVNSSPGQVGKSDPFNF